MKNNKGVTLIELVVVIGIMSSILLVISAFYISGVKGFTREASTADNQFHVRRASNEINRAVRMTNTAQNNAGKLRLTKADGTVTEYQLASNTLKADYYVLSGGTLTLDHSSNIVPGIQTFSFTCAADKVTFTLTSIPNAEGDSYSLNSELNIRK